MLHIQSLHYAYFSCYLVCSLQAYDIAAIKFRGTGAVLNYDIGNYTQEIEHLNEV